jgi:copper resistance protein C
MTMSKSAHLLIVTAFLWAMPTFAKAHAFLDHASPRVGSTVNPAPKELVLWFTQQLEPAFSSIEVRNEQGATVTAGRTTIGGDRTQLRIPLKALPPGSYKVIWRVLSVDTHRTEGNFTFRVGM